MKSFVRLSALIAFSLLSCGLFARNAGMPQAVEGKLSAAANTAATQSEPLAASPQFVIPGPLKPFLRLAGISQKVSAEEVLPLLSRNVFTEGFQGTSRPTEFLVLLRRYVVQARELAELAAHSGAVIRVSNCDDARPLLLILGYRTKGKCGDPELRCRQRMRRGLSWRLIPGSPWLNWSKRCKGESRSNTRIPRRPRQCSSTRAIGPRQAQKTSRK